MTDSKSGSGAKDAKKRQLPSWMSARDEENDDNKSAEAKSDEKKRKPSTSSDFSKLLEGVVFVLSGFVNPERSTLRSQALAMGAEYQADWNSGCTLLICAFPNTPKFRQVEAECGTIVAKEWISECYQQKKLVDIDVHLMHAGKPWRKSSGLHAVNRAKESSQARNADKAVEKKVQRKAATASSSKKAQSESVKEFSRSAVKQWVKDDLNKTMSWLRSQEEKPEPDQMNEIAAQGILTCIQDAIDLLEKNQDISQVTEQWSCIPRIVKELESLAKASQTSASKEDLHKQAGNYKHIYESELQSLADHSAGSEKKPKNGTSTQTRVNPSGDDAGYDSDDTIEMTEEEIDTAYKLTAS
uniref:BRCT domain-containing protein n=2 Tax=Kalanchoe fedtschenkoi TaxID=63787 RepID=A0A7N0RGY3_KALFE